MTYPRHTQISLEATPYYHVVSRCVRRSWLWGFDAYAGKDFSHRKAWILERLKVQSEVFAIDICSYAVMANHYHLVLHVDKAKANKWSDQEVVERWTTLYGTPELIRLWQNGVVSGAELESVKELIATWRSRLYSVSWYMRRLNEHLARQANEEDKCKGRFWEGRFKSQALLDEQGLLTAMAYVDLNPVRAGIAQVPEESQFTSIYDRIRELKGIETTDKKVPLMSFRAPGSKKGIPFTLQDYLALVDWTGKHITRPNKASINRGLPTLLTRLGIDASPWASSMRPAGNVFSRAIGRVEKLRNHAWNIGQEWMHGMKQSRRIFREG